LDEDEVTRLRICIRAMQQTLAATNDPDISLISDYFKETFEVRRNFVKTHNTNEILLEYPALRLHSCVCAILFLIVCFRKLSFFLPSASC